MVTSTHPDREDGGDISERRNGLCEDETAERSQRRLGQGDSWRRCGVAETG